MRSALKILILFIFFVNNILAQTVAVYYDNKVAPFEFAAKELSHSLESQGYAVLLKSLADYPYRKATHHIILAHKSHAELITLLAKEGGDTAHIQHLTEQAYAIRTTGKKSLSYWVIGGDRAGTMYGGLQMAEHTLLEGLGDRYKEDDAPYLTRRGIKFNIALDQKSPSFDSDGDQDKSNIKDVWDMSFWKSYLDDLARYRYNTLSFWTKHPFTSMIQLDDYPDVVIEDVTDGYGHLVKRMTIEEKIAFWQEVMAYANDRCIDIFYFTWNIYLNTAEGKYGITHDGNNELTKAYLRKSVKAFLLTYPYVDGIGVTAGERMRDLSFGEREEWLWDTYVRGILDVKEEQPNRHIRFIHRHWNTAVSDIMGHFEDYNDTFELCFKYARAHMYSSPHITFEDFLLDEMPEGSKCWWNVRNDDLFYLRWGDPDFVRDFLLGFDKAKTAGYLMGSDGYTWGRVYSDKDDKVKGNTEIRKHWYNFMLWGRLGYNPHLAQQVFKQHLASRFPNAPSDTLYLAWQMASKIVPQTTRFAWRDWDGNWYPEGCKSGHFLTVRDFMVGNTMEGSGIMNIADYCTTVLSKAPLSSITPFDVADSLEYYASQALALTAHLSSAPNTELKHILNDIAAFAYLGHYYSQKIRGATELTLYECTSEKEYQKRAISHLTLALNDWKQYAKVMDAQYTPKVLARTGLFDWNALTHDAERDIEIAQNFKSITIDIQFKNLKDGAFYPKGTKLNVDLDITSTHPIAKVGLVLNGEYLGVKKAAPFAWSYKTEASLKNMNIGDYALKAHVTDTEGNRIEKTIHITVR